MAKRTKIGSFTIRPFVRNGADNGQWQLDIPPYLTSDGKRKRRLFRSKEEAAREARRLARQVAIRGALGTPAQMNIGLVLHDILPDWIAHQKARVRTGKKRASSLATNLHQLKPVLDFFGKHDLAAIVEDRLVAYQERRLNEGVKPATINSEIATLLQVLKWAQKRDIIKKVPEVEGIPVILPDIEVPTEEEVARIIDCLPERLRPLVLLLATTGCRSGEALNLHWNDVDEVNGCIHIRPKAGGWEAKTTASYRRIPLSDQLLKMLRGLDKVGTYVFPSRSNPAKPLGGFRKSMAAAVKAAKVLRSGEPMHVTPHMLRKAYITWQTERGVDRAVLQRLAGHSRGSRVTDRHYVHPTNAARRNAVVELPIRTKTQD